MMQKSQLGQLSNRLNSRVLVRPGSALSPSVAYKMNAAQEHGLAGQESTGRAVSWGWSEKLTTEKTLTQ